MPSFDKIDANPGVCFVSMTELTNFSLRIFDEFLFLHLTFNIPTYVSLSEMLELCGLGFGVFSPEKLLITALFFEVLLFISSCSFVPA